MQEPPPNDTPASPPPDAAAIDSDDRRCLACGYMLRGLGPEPRCPECGLINIPEEFRRQVWDLVDSGRWFFSGFFRPFRKRPPGWWWALDRPGDVRRSWRYAIINMLVTLFVVAAIIGYADGWIVTTNYVWVAFVPDEVGPPIPVLRESSSRSLIVSREYFAPTFEKAEEFNDYNMFKYGERNFLSWEWHASIESFWPALVFVPWIWLTWIFPAFVGIATQIRRGLPSFARPPRTIVAAASYESHRMIYIAIALCAALVGACWNIRTTMSILPGLGASSNEFILLPAFLIAVIYAALGWIGPLRSDYTHQLIQSRFHAGRIIVMYAIVLPIPTVMASWMVLGWLMSIG
ncbi:MAG: hypothetical protein J5J06_07365 [Phycisphaerae bacterium]|nr:hypothetical protein [Phycisphaerae bacterium]